MSSDDRDNESTDSEVPGCLNPQQDNVHDDFNNIYADGVPMSPPYAAIAQPDDLEDLYIDPLLQVAQEDNLAALDADETGRVVSFSQNAFLVSKLFIVLQRSTVVNHGSLADVDPVIEEAQDAPKAEDNLDPVFELPTIDDLNISLAFINLICSATLDNGGLDAETIHRLRHPPKGPPDTDNPNLLLAIKIYLAVTKASQDTYTSVSEAILEHFPDCDFLSVDVLKSKIKEMTGTVLLINENSCIGYTGPFAELTYCPKCGEFRYNQIQYDASQGETQIPHKTFLTIPLGPQLQAMQQSCKSAEAM